jgi:hypothetical protein
MSFWRSVTADSLPVEPLLFLCHEDWQSLPIIPSEIAQIGYIQNRTNVNRLFLGRVLMNLRSMRWKIDSRGL